MSTRRKKNDPKPDRPQDRVKICRLPTGVPGLDEILGGGLPEYSFNIIAGAPGSGKTTLAHQLAFANASSATPALYFTVLGEPAIKMLRYQQQFTFFAISPRWPDLKRQSVSST
jgi:circadian clock protein KaiC